MFSNRLRSLGAVMALSLMSLPLEALPIMSDSAPRPRRRQNATRRHNAYRGRNYEPPLAHRVGSRAAERYRLRILVGKIPRNQILVLRSYAS